MDEKYIDFLIYGAVLVISAIGMYNKARKQKQQQSSGSPSGPHPWEIEEEEEEAVVRPVRQEPVPAESAIPSRPATIDDAPAGAMAMRGAATDRRVSEMIATEGGRSTRHMDSDLGKANATATHKEAEHAGPLVDFDLRKAIIYSEILKPKYQEY